jgi:hypothetical protein
VEEKVEQTLPSIRDEKGHFLPGHPLLARSPGRPKSAAVDRIRYALESVVDEETLTEWAKKIRRRMVKGELPAAEFVLDRIIGKPVQSIDIAGQLDVKLYETVSPDDWEKPAPGPAPVPPDPGSPEILE